MASLMFFGNSKLYFKWSWNVCVRSTNRKVEKKQNTRAFEPHVGENIKLNVICLCWGVSHQAVVVPIRGHGSRRADSLPTQPLPTNCYCDKSHLNKYAGYLRGSSYFELNSTAWILPVSLQLNTAKQLVMQATRCGSFVLFDLKESSMSKPAQLITARMHHVQFS